MNLNDFTEELLSLSSTVNDAELGAMPVIIRTDLPGFAQDYGVAALHFRREDGIMRCIIDMGVEQP